MDDSRPSQILPHLYVGARAHAKDRSMLRALNVKRVLNATPPRSMDPVGGVPCFFEKEKTILYKRVPIFDNRGEGLLAHLDASVAFIEQGKYYGSVLVHCRQGVSRSIAIIVAYLMKTRGLSLDDALAYVRSRRAVSNPHEAFLKQLRSYDEALRREREARAASGHPDTFPNDLLGGGTGTAVRGPQRGPSGPPRRPADSDVASAPAGPQLPPIAAPSTAAGPAAAATPATAAPNAHENGSHDGNCSNGAPSAEEEGKGGDEAIGPAVPEHLLLGSGSDAAEAAAAASSSERSSESEAHEAGAIGPAMPPHVSGEQQRTARLDNSEDQRGGAEAGGEAVEGADGVQSEAAGNLNGSGDNGGGIGPALPPHVQAGKRKAEEPPAGPPRKAVVQKGA